MTEQKSPITLQPKHKLFADKYLVCGNASESAVHAGYSKRSRGVTGSKLLARPDIKLYLAEQTEKLSANTEDIQSRWLKEVEALSFASIGDFISIDEDGHPQVDFSTATPEQLKAIASVASKQRNYYDNRGNKIGDEKSSRFAMADKYRGLDMIARHLGLYKEAEQRVVVDVADRLLAARQRFAKLESAERGYGD